MHMKGYESIEDMVHLEILLSQQKDVVHSQWAPGGAPDKSKNTIIKKKLGQNTLEWKKENGK